MLDELRHWKRKKDHKYIMRIPLKRRTKGRKWRYFYSKEEYQAYLDGLKETKIDGGKKPIDNKRDIKSTSLNFLQTKTEQKVSKLSNTFGADTTIAEKGKMFVSELFKHGFGTATRNLAIRTAQDIWDALDDRRSADKSDNKNNTKNDDKSPTSFNDLYKKTREYTPEEDMAEVNPNYDPSQLDYSMNCIWCTAAYDLRRRGYDVEAGPDTDGETMDEVLSWYENPDVKTLTDTLIDSDYNYYDYDTDEEANEAAAKIIEKQMLSNGEGARGHYLVWWTNGGGHDVAWEVERGKVVLRDAQTNDTYTVEELLPYISEGHYFRTDNLEPTEKVLKNIKNKKRS